MKILKIIGLSLLVLVLVVVLGTTLVVNLVPAFGKAPDAAARAEYESSENFQEEVFINAIPTSMDMSFANMRSVLKDYIVGIADPQPEEPIGVLRPDMHLVNTPSDTLTQLIWFGHSAFLLQTNGKNILLDPMLGEAPSPLPALGAQRFTEGLPIAIDSLPAIDVVLFSHDHYDHLDYPTLMELKDRVGHFVVPLGIESHLISWGFAREQITVLDWWEEVTIEGIDLISTPARHFSGRGLTDRNRTLWSSWVIQSPQSSIFFSGDGGYGPHFQEIGDRFGPFDLALMECGQYDDRWREIHMMPEETVQAAIDVRADVFAPIHWGAFVLALHSWYDPVDRALNEAIRLDAPITVPQIGQVITVPSDDYSFANWWESYK